MFRFEYICKIKGGLDKGSKYYFQIRNIVGKVIVSGSVHADSMDSAYDKVMKREGITLEKQYYSSDSMYAGLVFRERLMKNNRPESLLIGKYRKG